MSNLTLSLLALYLVVLVCGMANTIGYHRMLSHRSFRTSRFVRYSLTFWSALYSGSPRIWVGAHRAHHTLSDRDGDPHTPTKEGFWYAHCGWLCGTNKPLWAILFALSGVGLQVRFLLVDIKRALGKQDPVWRKLTRDLGKERFMRILDTPFVIPAMFAAQIATCWLVGGWWGIVWLWAAHFILNNATWIVNSACHWPGVGNRAHDTRDQSRNVPWLTLLTHGEANHNTHHRYPKSACHGLEGQLDPSWFVIRTLARARLVWDIHLPKNYDTKRKDEAWPRAIERTS